MSNRPIFSPIHLRHFIFMKPFILLRSGCLFLLASAFLSSCTTIEQYTHITPPSVIASKNSATLDIYREPSNQLASLPVYVNNEHIGDIKNNEHIVWLVKSGTVTISTTKLLKKRYRHHRSLHSISFKSKKGQQYHIQITVTPSSAVTMELK